MGGNVRKRSKLRDRETLSSGKLNLLGVCLRLAGREKLGNMRYLGGGEGKGWTSEEGMVKKIGLTK